jgi:hypothetical protein
MVVTVAQTAAAVNTPSLVLAAAEVEAEAGSLAQRREVAAAEVMPAQAGMEGAGTRA